MVDEKVTNFESELRKVKRVDQLHALYAELFDEIEITHYLLTGLPMPGRNIGRLMIKSHWPDERRMRRSHTQISGTDPVLNACLTASAPLQWNFSKADGYAVYSELIDSAANEVGCEVIAVPFDYMKPYQGALVVATQNATFDRSKIALLDRLCQQIFDKLVQLGKLNLHRPGDLSARERRVLELTAVGIKAAEIAILLNISQRTVHAHLQNSSDKLNASNKTHTVVEALRYSQIVL